MVRDKGVAGFVKNSERLVDRFDVMIRANVAIAVRRQTTARLAPQIPFKGQQRPRHRGCRPPNIFEQAWHCAKRRQCWWRARPGADSASGLSLRIPPWARRRGSLANSCHHYRTDHLHDVRPLRAGSVLCTVRASALLGLLCAIPWAKSATAMPRRQNTEAVKMRRLKKADCEVDFFFIDEVEFSLRSRVLILSVMPEACQHFFKFFTKY